MNKKHIKYLVCPKCKSQLYFYKIIEKEKDKIKTGILKCKKCNSNYGIIHFIPRFIPVSNYCNNYGLWGTRGKVLSDSNNGSKIVETRFFNETKFNRSLKGEILLEAGCGGGRFTEVAVKTNAMVLSVDMGYCVEANYKTNGHNDNLLIVQADICNMPFKTESVDKIFCFGVLQFMPNPERAFKTLTSFLKKNGKIVIDVFGIREGIKGFFVNILQTKRLVRPITSKIEPERLYYLCKKYINSVWTVSKIIHKIPYFGKRIKWFFLIADFRDNEGRQHLSDSQQKQCVIQDTFGMLSSVYDNPQKIKTVKNWFNDTNLKNIEVFWGYSGINGRGTRL